MGRFPSIAAAKAKTGATKGKLYSMYARDIYDKAKCKMGSMNSVSYNYDHLAIVTFKCDNEEEILMALLDDNIEVVDEEYIDGNITISVSPQDQTRMKNVIESIYPSVEYLIDEVGMYAKDKVKLTGEDKEYFDRLLSLLDEVEDVKAVYHNVEE